MKPTDLNDICRMVGAEPPPENAARTLISSISSDSRAMPPGSLFIAIKGESHDGHDYLPQARAAGAVAALVDRPMDASAAGLPLVRVADARVAMGHLARNLRRRLRGKVIAVAGSNGKTSTKHLIHAALGPRFRGSMSPKSYNNDIGVPLAIFPADENQDYLVLEMGTNHPGEIENLSRMAEPDIAVITNCTAEHLEGLGDLDGVRRENASILAGLKRNGTIAWFGDDPALSALLRGYGGSQVTFGFERGNDFVVSDCSVAIDGTRFRINGHAQWFFVPLLGRHAAVNALAAGVVATRMGLDLAEAMENLRTARGPEMRLQIQHAGGVTILNDAYNSNPASAAAAIATLCDLPAAGRHIAVIGEMRELGAAGPGAHIELGAEIARRGDAIDWLYCVGPAGRIVRQAAIDGGFDPGRIVECSDAADAARIVPERLGQGDLVLLKASRGVRLEKVAAAITAPAVPV